jgi:hypothetical protein
LTGRCLTFIKSNLNKEPVQLTEYFDWGLDSRGIRARFPVRARAFHTFIVTRPALGSTQRPVLWVLRYFPRGYSGRGVTALKEMKNTCSKEFPQLIFFMKLTTVDDRKATAGAFNRNGNTL